MHMQLTTAKNLDVSFLCIIKNYVLLDDSLKKDLDNFLTEIKKDLILNNDIKILLNRRLGQIFMIRLKAINFFIKQGFDIETLYEQAFPQIEQIMSVERLNILGENIMFAFRSNYKVVKNLSQVLKANNMESFNE